MSKKSNNPSFEQITIGPSKFVQNRIVSALNVKGGDVDELVSERLTIAFTLEDVANTPFADDEMLYLFALFAQRYRQILKITELDSFDPVARGLASETFKYFALHRARLVAGDEPDHMSVSVEEIRAAEFMEQDFAVDVLQGVMHRNELSGELKDQIEQVIEQLEEEEELSACDVHHLVYGVVIKACFELKGRET